MKLRIFIRVIHNYPTYKRTFFFYLHIIVLSTLLLRIIHIIQDLNNG